MDAIGTPAPIPMPVIALTKHDLSGWRFYILPFCFYIKNTKKFQKR